MEYAYDSYELWFTQSKFMLLQHKDHDTISDPVNATFIKFGQGNSFLHNYM